MTNTSQDAPQGEPVDLDRADQRLIGHAAAQLRHQAILAGYAGLPNQHVAFSLALVLDELGRHVRELHTEVRRQAVASARVLVDDAHPPFTGP